MRAACITVDLHESDKINTLLGPLLINTELYLISTEYHVIEGYINHLMSQK